jgi:hypothetical protein
MRDASFPLPLAVMLVRPPPLAILLRSIDIINPQYFACALAVQFDRLDLSWAVYEDCLWSKGTARTATGYFACTIVAVRYTVWPCSCPPRRDRRSESSRIFASKQDGGSASPGWPAVGRETASRQFCGGSKNSSAALAHFRPCAKAGCSRAPGAACWVGEPRGSSGFER